MDEIIIRIQRTSTNDFDCDVFTSQTSLDEGDVCDDGWVYEAENMQEAFLFCSEDVKNFIKSKEE